MELLRRSRGDETLKPGEMLNLRQRLRRLAARHDLTTVISCAFDHRTRMLPFVYAPLRMSPAGVRAIGSAMVDAGFPKTRIVLQQWNPNFRPTLMRVDGRIPDIFMVSAMQIHTDACKALLRDVCRMDPDCRPLIIAGGPKTVYEPWDVFNNNPRDPWSADVAVTGEEFVLLSLLEILLSMHDPGTSLRNSFLRARDSGLFNDVPGLVFAKTDRFGVTEQLVDTGVQRLLADLDELPHPVLGYTLLEPPGRKAELGAKALSAGLVRKYSPVSSLVLTFGCKFACSYCPIPAYNQRQHRLKSGERIADEFRRLNQEYGLRYFFGADDNFFNSKQRTLSIVEELARTQINGKPLRKSIRWGTEVTVHDTLQMKDHLPTIRAAGVRALWLGVEDMTATFVNKGQSVDKTTNAFRLLQKNGICPMPMMMHHDSQPLYSRGSDYGLLNQVRLLRKAGAVSLQVLMMTPATGSKLYESAFTSATAYESAGGRKVESHMLDGNFVVASNHKQPWRKQLNMIAAYLYFYNPLRLMFAVVRPKSRLYLADASVQVIGMCGLVQTIRRTSGWLLRLMRGKIVKLQATPGSSIPFRSVGGIPEAPVTVPLVVLGGPTVTSSPSHETRRPLIPQTEPLIVAFE
ncbi:MAG: radical SAM protein [Planctomycetota bacterium]